jgi:glycosyltransferase involved in cell wall biosynthesis
MKIGIDARFAVHNRRGIGNYTLNLIQNLAEIDNYNEYILYIDKNDTENILPKRDNFIIKKLLPSNYLIWEQFMLPMQVKRDGIDILHCTGNTAPVFISKNIKLVLTIHDVSYLKPYSITPRSPYLYQRLGRTYRRNFVPRVINKANIVITVSEFAKRDILNIFPGCNSSMVRVIYESGNKRFQFIPKKEAQSFCKSKFGITGKYILNVGGRDPQKNTASIVTNLLKLKLEGKLSEQIVIVGFSNWQKSDIYKSLEMSDYRKDFKFIDFADQSDLMQLYNGAEIFIFVSFYESFGLPLLEAMTCGIPVIASTTGAMPEIAGDAAFLINPYNGQELQAAVIKILNDENLRDDLIARGLKKAKEYSWAQTAKQTLAIYESVYNNRPADNYD